MIANCPIWTQFCILVFANILFLYFVQTCICICTSFCCSVTLCAWSWPCGPKSNTARFWPRSLFTLFFQPISQQHWRWGSLFFNLSHHNSCFFINILLYPTLYILNLLHHPPALRSFYIWNADFPADLRGKGGGVRLSHSDQLDSWNLWLSQILFYVFCVSNISCLKRQFVLNSLFRKNGVGSFYTISAKSISTYYHSHLMTTIKSKDTS